MSQATIAAGRRIRDAGVSAPITSMTLASTEVLEGGAVWLRYRLQNR